MCNLARASAILLAAAAILAAARMGAAMPPGPVDGQNIPTDFGAGSLLATQTNMTAFGEQQVTAGSLTVGSELDALYLAVDPAGVFGPELKIGLAGNLQSPNHIHIFIGGIAGGQQELMAQGVDGPPHTLQAMSPAIALNTNGTSDPFDDTCEVTTAGVKLPCTADYALSLDIFSIDPGTSERQLSVSEYALFDFSIGDLFCGEVASAPQFAFRSFVTQTRLSDTNGLATNDQGFGYERIGMDNSNAAGVTGTSGAGAASALKGIEMSVPIGNFGLVGDETITLLVMLTGDTGYVSNQMLPSHPTCTTEAFRPDLSALGNCLTVDLSTLAAWSGGVNDSDGVIDPANYGGNAAAVQTCPTDFGDQHIDPAGTTLSPGSELDQLFATNDNEFLYLGLTGNLESSQNGLLLFVDSVPGGQGSFTNFLDFPFYESRVAGMIGSRLPIHPDGSTELDYDYVLEINGYLEGGKPANEATYFADFNDLNGPSRRYLGLNNVNSNGDAFFADAGNVNGFSMAYNFMNGSGVSGCAEGEACDLLDVSSVAAQAATAESGFEMALPLADIGVNALPAEVCLFAFVTNQDGYYGSNQGLPPLRDPSGTLPGDSVQNTGASIQTPSIDFSNDGSVGTCEFPFDLDCQFAYFTRAACITLMPVCVQGTGDADADGDVDLADYPGLAACLAGPGGGLDAGCDCFDFDGDSDNDLLDFAVFERLITP